MMAPLSPTCRRPDAVALAMAYQGMVDGGRPAVEAAFAVGLTARHARRLVRLLLLPSALQDAVRSRSISASAAFRIFELSQSDQAAIVERIDSGEAADAVVAGFLAKPRQPRPQRQARPTTEFARAKLDIVIRVFESSFFREYCEELEEQLGPDHYACRELVRAHVTARELRRRFATSARELRAAIGPVDQR